MYGLKYYCETLKIILVEDILKCMGKELHRPTGAIHRLLTFLFVNSISKDKVRLTTVTLFKLVASQAISPS